MTVFTKVIGILFLLNYSTLLYANSLQQNELAPDVIRVDSWEYTTTNNATILANRLLQEESTQLKIDSDKLASVTREIDSILSQIQTEYPHLPNLSVLETYKSSVVIVKLKPELLEIITQILDDVSNERITLKTGNVEFDALNAQLGLSAVQIFTSTKIAIFYFNDSLNVPLASMRYSSIEDIEFAHPNNISGDGSDLAVQKLKGVWYVVFRHAWGDCPAGCLNSEFYFFEVKGTETQLIDGKQAMKKIEFLNLVDHRGWRYSP